MFTHSRVSGTATVGDISRGARIVGVEEVCIRSDCLITNAELGTCLSKDNDSLS